MATVTFQGVSKKYGEVLAVENLSLEIKDGEFMVLVGPSGCGKTTSLRMIAGLEDITDGTLLIGDKVVNDIAPKDRDIADFLSPTIDLQNPRFKQLEHSHE